MIPEAHRSGYKEVSGKIGTLTTTVETKKPSLVGSIWQRGMINGEEATPLVDKTKQYTKYN